jgi:hypothetical protein
LLRYGLLQAGVCAAISLEGQLLEALKASLVDTTADSLRAAAEQAPMQKASPFEIAAVLAATHHV